jgi:hypothetical protein
MIERLLSPRLADIVEAIERIRFIEASARRSVAFIRCLP